MLAAAMLPAGLLGDRYGHKKVLLTALGIFGMGSVACAYSTSVGTFMAARVLLGLAGAGVIVMAISSLTVLFSKAERPKAVGLWSAANFLALPLGPLLGGWLLTHYWWGWVFLINVPVAVLALVAVAALVPESRASKRLGLDPVGVLASAAGLVAVTYGLIKAGQNGWGDAGALLLMAAGVFVHGIDAALVVSAGIAVAGAILALIYLPRTNTPEVTGTPGVTGAPDAMGVTAILGATDAMGVTGASSARIQARNGQEDEVVRTQ